MLRLPSTRREFLRLSSRGISLLAFSRFAPQFLVQAAAAAPLPEADRRVLVLVQLAGGNDGLNTVVPFTDPSYHALRPTLALPTTDLLPINDQLAFHSACAPLHALLKEGQLGIVQNVGYPNPNRSHFRSTEIWETAASAEQNLPTGWIGRYLDHACAGAPRPTASDPLAIHVNSEVPQSFGGAQPHPTYGLSLGNRAPRSAGLDASLLERLTAVPPASELNEPLPANHAFLRATLMDTLVAEKKIQRILDRNRPEATYPSGPFAQALRNIAGLVAANLPTRVYFVSLGGFDTHANQLGAHAKLLRELSTGLAAFQTDLRARGLSDRVLTMTFSEFGRRPGENQSGGTDHGTSAPLFVLGSRVQGSLHGSAPLLDRTAGADLNHSTDFRSVYATALEQWLDTPSEPILGGTFAPLDFISRPS